MVDPCRTTTSGTGFTVRCGWPLERLEGGGILAWWTTNGSASWSFEQDARGRPITVGGRPAKLLVRSGCRFVGGEVAMTAVIPYPTLPDNWYELDACIRGPRTDLAEAQIRALLDSTSFPGG